MPTFAEKKTSLSRQQKESPTAARWKEKRNLAALGGEIRRCSPRRRTVNECSPLARENGKRKRGSQHKRKLGEARVRRPK